MMVYSLVLMLVVVVDKLNAIVSNNTCAPVPKDKRQLVCHCSKQLQLRCNYNSDINRFESKNLDKTLRPIFYDEVTIARLTDPNDLDDLNLNFELNKRRFLNNRNQFYLHFPNFNTLNAPYIRTTFNRYYYIPPYAFNDPSNPRDEQKLIESVVFELPEVYDFGIDEYAFFGLDVKDNLLIEGPFNQMTIHKKAFESSHINELIIGCYCIECETFDGSCKVMFNQESKFSSLNRRIVSKLNSSLKSVKLYGIEFDWNLDTLPNMASIEKLEISNSKINSNQEYELKSNHVYNNLDEFYFKNNYLKNLFKLNLFKHFPNLKLINLGQNRIEQIDPTSFAESSKNSLLELNMERNKIHKLYNGIFGDNLSSLRVLVLSQNQIESVQDLTFKNLINLETLDLTRNKLTHLTKFTFYGLGNLKKLLLSYNPFKSFDPNTFKLVPNLKRLDIISNTESDWFTFENNDVCLLSHFKCETQINIDLDQRCNCFVKYSNLIAVSENSNDIKWFRQCLTDDNSNKHFDYENEDDSDLDISLRKHNSLDYFKSNNIEPKLECSNDLIKNCYSEYYELANSSCLYKRFVSLKQANSKDNSENKNTQKYMNNNNNNNTQFWNKEIDEIETDNDIESVDGFNLTDTITIRTSQINNLLDQTSRNFEKITSTKESVHLAIGQSNLIWEKYTIEQTFSLLFFCICILFLVSIISLIVGICSIKNRRYKHSYQPADGLYAQDE